MVIGLSLLLVIRLALFVLAGLAWQGVINEHILIPPLDRAATLFGLILILWMWGFPEPLRWGDSAAWLLALLAATGLTLNLVWWTGQGSAQYYNGSWADNIGEIACIVIIVVAILVLFVRKPNGWGFGFGLFALALAGHIAYLALARIEGDYSGLVRLSEMTYYPLLLFLPQRFPLPKHPATSAIPSPEVRQGGLEPKILQAIFALTGEEESAKVCLPITQVISTSLLADYCLMLVAPKDSNEIVLTCGYDLIREVFLPEVTFPTKSLPLIAASFNRNLPLRLPASSTSEDLRTLGHALHLERPGHLLGTPVITADGKPLAIIILLSPYSSRAWTSEDQLLISSLASPVAQLLQRKQTLETLENGLNQAQRELASSHTQAEKLQAEIEELNARLKTWQDAGEENRAKAESLAALIASQSESDRLPLPGTEPTPENIFPGKEKLAQAFLQQPPVTSPEAEYMESELRMALEEVAQLKSALADADKSVLTLENQIAGQAPSDEHYEEIISIVQEMRHPMSSILGYTDFLLGESVGILGAMQRKFLERIKILTERINRLVSELTRMTAMKMSGERIVTEGGVDFYAIIEGAISESMLRLRERNIKLRVNTPEDLPKVNADSDAVRQVLINLIENAKEVTAENGEVTLSASLQDSDHHRSYILVQISDQGGGIPAEYIPRVFSRFDYADGTPIPGTGGKSSHLSMAKILVDNFGGRIWVDNQAEAGATFSILLPVIERALKNDEPGVIPA